MLGYQGFMRKAFENQTLEKRSVEFKAATLFNCQIVVVDFRTQLPVKRQRQQSVPKVDINSRTCGRQ